MLEKTYIIITTYNAMCWLSECLGSCGTNNVIVVDNNSTDKTVNFIQENYPSIKLIQQPKNLGFGRANNIGIAYALKRGAEYVFLLNQDAYLELNTIEKLIEVHKENQEYGIVSPIHLNGNGEKLDLNFSYFIKENNSLLFDALQNKNIKDIYEVPFVNAAAWLLPKETLMNVGGFDPIFSHYGEDNNYCQRILFHNLKIGIVPNSYVFHDREFRKNDDDEKEELRYKERFFKCRWANVNIEIEDNINEAKRELKKLIFKLILKFKFKKARYYVKELEGMINIEPEIIKSRNQNKMRGTHYL